MNQPQPNEGKNLTIETSQGAWDRLPIKTHLIQKGDNISEVVKKYAATYLVPGDMIFISERIVAIAQGRAWPIKEIRPSWWAKFLVRFVHKSPHGIGLKSPWTMELALREAGLGRILLAAAASALTKPFGFRGVFYKAVGNNINAIDGPCSYTLPPYNEYAKLGPKNPEKAAKEIAIEIGYPIVIIDANDLGVTVLGKSESRLADKLCQEIFRDNPLGQSREQTPLCIIRRLVTS